MKIEVKDERIKLNRKEPTAKVMKYAIRLDQIVGISRNTLLDFIYKYGCPHYKFGNKLYVLEDEFYKWFYEREMNK